MPKAPRHPRTYTYLGTLHCSRAAIVPCCPVPRAAALSLPTTITTVILPLPLCVHTSHSSPSRVEWCTSFLFFCASTSYSTSNEPLAGGNGAHRSLSLVYLSLTHLPINISDDLEAPPLSLHLTQSQLPTVHTRA